MPDGGMLANAAWVRHDVEAEVWQPAPPLDYNAWGQANVRFGSESPFPGPYNPELFPHFRRPLEVLSPEHPARTVVIMKPAQEGGTVLAMIFAGGSLADDPSGFLFVHPTDVNGVRWTKTKWRPFVRNCRALKGLFASTTSRDGLSSMTYMERTDGRGFLQVSGANSPAQLSMMSFARQVQDDLAKWELNQAGDPEKQADSRSKAYADRKVLKISTPLFEDSCRIYRNYKRSTQERWHVPCPHCDHTHVLEWDNFLQNLDPDHPELAHFTCPDCGGVIEQHHRPWMMARGEWVADNPSARTVGFHFGFAYSPLTTWAEIAEAWLDAEGDAGAEQTFFNDTLGWPYRQAGESPPWEELQKRADETGHQVGTIPAGYPLLTAGVDCQDTWVDIHIQAFGPDIRKATVERIVFSGHISEQATRNELDQLLKRTWRNTAGHALALDMLAIDGNAWTEDVWDWARRHPQSRVMMVRGAKGDSPPFLAKVKRERDRNGKLLKWRGRFYNVGVSPMKAALYKNLRKEDPLERGYVVLPAGLDEDFFQQYCAERRIAKKRKDGFVTYQWIKDAAQRNEVLDCALYGEAAAIRKGWRDMKSEKWDALLAERETPVTAGQLDLEDYAGSACAGQPATKASRARSRAKRLPH